MPGISTNDFNIVDEFNSSTTSLPVNGVFTGIYTDTTAYSSISISCLSDVGSKFSGLAVQWSTDGVNNDIAPQLFTFDPLVVTQDGFTVHATVRARFFRVLYENNASFPQGFFTLTTLLRKGTPAGTVRSIDPVNTFTTNLDVQITQALVSGLGRFNGEQVQIASMDDVNLPSDGPFLFVSPRPTRSSTFRQSTPVSLSPVKLAATSAERATFISITNAVLRGNLYIKLESITGLSVTNYDYKILPGHTWQVPGEFGSGYPGDLYGVWDEAYIHSPTVQLGNAVLVRNVYG